MVARGPVDSMMSGFSAMMLDFRAECFFSAVGWAFEEIEMDRASRKAYGAVACRIACQIACATRLGMPGQLESGHGNGGKDWGKCLGLWAGASL